MKRLKALIKMEARPALLVGILFLVANLVGLIGVQTSIHSIWSDYLERGITGYLSHWDAADLIGHNFYPSIYLVGGLYIPLLIILVFGSFKQDRSVEVGRFLKSLPYTEQERFLVKIGTGIAITTIGLFTYTLGLLGLRSYALSLFREPIEVTAMMSIEKELSGIDRILLAMLLCYVVVIAIYLFMMMMQYMINGRIAAIIIGIGAFAAPLFIMQTIMVLFDLPWDGGFGALGDTLAYLMIQFIDYVPFTLEASLDYYMGSYVYLSGFSYHLLFYGIIALGSFIISLYLVRKHRLEESDVLMPERFVRWIFIVGVSICGSIVICFLARLLFNHVFFMAGSLSTLMVFIIGMIPSFFLGKKIAYIGTNKRKEVRG